MWPQFLLLMSGHLALSPNLLSTKEMVERVRLMSRTNKPPPMQERDNVMVIEMDIVVLYLSIKKEMAMEAVKIAIRIADTRWDNVDKLKLVRRVALTAPRTEIEKLGLSEVVLTPKTKTTMRSFTAPRKTARGRRSEHHVQNWALK